jgi:hypothetical protein
MFSNNQNKMIDLLAVATMLISSATTPAQAVVNDYFALSNGMQQMTADLQWYAEQQPCESADWVYF